MTNLRAILFDVDGTLADTEQLGHRPAYNRAFKKLGLQWRWGPKLYRKLLTQPGGRERLRHYLKRYRPELGEHEDAVEQNADAWVQNVHQLKSQYFRSRVRRGKVPLRPGVARLMREARIAGIRIAIVTNASRATLEPLLKHSLSADLVAHIDLIVGGEDVANKKPAPDLYLAALARLGVAAAECVAVEDSRMGLESARAAGIETIITTNANTEHENFAGARLVLDGLGEPGVPPRVAVGELNGCACVTTSLLSQLLGAARPRAAHAA